jgi:hypothetical protein
MVSDNGRKQLQDAGQHQHGESENDDVVGSAWLHRILRQSWALHDGNLLEITRRVDTAFFQRRQRRLVHDPGQRLSAFRGAGTPPPSG